MSTNLRSKVIRLAHSKPELRGVLLPLLKQATEWPTEEARKKHLQDHPGANPSDHTVKKTEVSKSPELQKPKSNEAGVHIHDKAKVKGQAVVEGKARVRGSAEVRDGAQVWGEAEIEGNAQVSHQAMVSGKAWVGGNAHISGTAEVSGKARISGTAVILGGKWDGSEGPITSGKWKAPGVPA